MIGWPLVPRLAGLPVLVAALRRAPWPMPVSVVLHVGLVLVLIMRAQGAGNGSPAQIEPPSIEIDLVDQPATQRGTPAGAESGDAAAASAASPPAPPMEAPAAVASDAPPVPDQPATPPAAVGALGVPMPARYVPATPGQAQQAAESRTARNEAADLGNAERDQMALLVQGRNVVPPQPDAQHHNRPPSYPPDAARRKITGTVELVVHVTPQGTAGTVRISRSSGVPSLDRSAADAIRAWHFTPALRDGAAIAFDYPISIRFTIGNS